MVDVWPGHGTVDAVAGYKMDDAHVVAESASSVVRNVLIVAGHGAVLEDDLLVAGDLEGEVRGSGGRHRACGRGA